MEFWKSLIILKEIKKPNGKLLRFLAKNQWGLKLFEKILKFTYINLNGKLIFHPFSLPSSRSFVILYSSGTSKNGGWGVGRGSSWTGLWEYFRVWRIFFGNFPVIFFWIIILVAHHCAQHFHSIIINRATNCTPSTVQK